MRGTSRREDGVQAIREAGAEAAVADPASPGTVLELIGDVAVVVWLLGSAQGRAGGVRRVHGGALEALLERFVDTPVRAVAYEADGGADPGALAAGREAAERARATWRIPIAFLDAPPGVGAADAEWRDWARVTAGLVEAAPGSLEGGP